MKRVIQIVGVIILLWLTVIIRKELNDYIKFSYDYFVSFYVQAIIIYMFQLCYWLIEKPDKLFRLFKKFHYFIGVTLILITINFAFYFGYLNITFMSFGWYLDLGVIAIVTFIISTLIGNYLMDRLLAINAK